MKKEGGAMTDAELLQAVKDGLGVTGTYQDKALQAYIDEVREYMLDAGVAPAVINSRVSKGAITRGVSDLWCFGSAAFSTYFMQRVTQLAFKKESEVEDG